MARHPKSHHAGVVCSPTKVESSLLVWILDDDENERNMLAEAMQRLHQAKSVYFDGRVLAPIRKFTTGGELVDQLENVCPDLIIADVVIGDDSTAGAYLVFKALSGKKWTQFRRPFLIGTSGHKDDARTYTELLNKGDKPKWADYAAKPEVAPGDPSRTKLQYWQRHVGGLFARWKTGLAVQNEIGVPLDALVATHGKWTAFRADLQAAAEAGRKCHIVQADTVAERMWLAEMLHTSLPGADPTKFVRKLADLNHRPDLDRTFRADVVGVVEGSSLSKTTGMKGEGFLSRVATGTLMLDGFDDVDALDELIGDLATLADEGIFVPLGAHDSRKFEGRLILGLNPERSIPERLRDSEWHGPLVLPSPRDLDAGAVIDGVKAMSRRMGIKKPLCSETEAYLKQTFQSWSWQSLHQCLRVAIDDLSEYISPEHFESVLISANRETGVRSLAPEGTMRIEFDFDQCQLVIDGQESKRIEEAIFLLFAFFALEGPKISSTTKPQIVADFIEWTKTYEKAQKVSQRLKRGSVMNSLVNGRSIDVRGFEKEDRLNTPFSDLLKPGRAIEKAIMPKRPDLWKKIRDALGSGLDSTKKFESVGIAVGIHKQ